MPSKRLATVIEVYCPNDGHLLNMRIEEGEEERWIRCWNCNQQIFLHNGFGPSNYKVYVEGEEEIRGRRVKKEIRLRSRLIWQQEP